METHHFRNAFKGWKEGSEVTRAVCTCTRSQEAPMPHNHPFPRHKKG